jgi:hypothetical protein
MRTNKIWWPSGANDGDPVLSGEPGMNCRCVSSGHAVKSGPPLSPWLSLSTIVSPSDEYDGRPGRKAAAAEAEIRCARPPAR